MDTPNWLEFWFPVSCEAQLRVATSLAAAHTARTVFCGAPASGLALTQEVRFPSEPPTVGIVSSWEPPVNRSTAVSEKSRQFLKGVNTETPS